MWTDTNANGVQDNGELGKSGVTVELYTCVNNIAGVLVDTKVTDANGIYNFTGLVPGDYIVKFIAADGSVLSTANVGNDALDSDAGVGGFTGCYTLVSGDNNTTVDAGSKPIEITSASPKNAWSSRLAWRPMPASTPASAR